MTFFSIIMNVALGFVIFGLRKLYLNQLRLKKYMELYLTDLNPMLKRVMEKITLTTDKKLQSLDVRELISEEALIMLNEIKTAIKNMGATSSDPEDKFRTEKISVEIESITNLMATVDNKSSPEYIQQVCEEIMLSIEKMRNGIT